MSERRFPPLFSAPSIVSAVLSLVVTLAVLFVIGNASPFWIMTSDPALRFAFAVLVVCIVACGIGLYIFVAPRMWSFTKRYTPEAQGQQSLPDHLVAACLHDIDFPCPACTYNLRGAKAGACPECNTPIVVYLYGTQRTSTKWTGLIICWLALTLVASVIALAAVWSAAMDILKDGLNWYGYREIDAVVIALVSFTSVVICGWRAVALSVPKPPHKQSICARRTATWLAAISAACAVAVAIVFGRAMLSGWY